jgi:hypothetical protein
MTHLPAAIASTRGVESAIDPLLVRYTHSKIRLVLVPSVF